MCFVLICFFWVVMGWCGLCVGVVFDFGCCVVYDGCDVVLFVGVGGVFV